jgi:hypothetical protein
MAEIHGRTTMAKVPHRATIATRCGFLRQRIARKTAAESTSVWSATVAR